MPPVPASVLDHPVEGVNLTPGTLRDQLGETPTLLVFLRHFGCIFCREMVGDLRKASTQQAAYPPVLFVYQGTPEQGRAFFEGLWPEARAIADLPRVLYDAFGLERGSVGQMFGPVVWACGVRAAAKGHFIGAPVGDPWVMPGLFLVEGPTVRWHHDFAHAGDHPAFDTLPERLAAEAAL
ncbi:MAG: peroxiredoxin-like family protein [Bacteroidota bacterium]